MSPIELTAAFDLWIRQRVIGFISDQDADQLRDLDVESTRDEILRAYIRVCNPSQTNVDSIKQLWSEFDQARFTDRDRKTSTQSYTTNDLSRVKKVFE